MTPKPLALDNVVLHVPDVSAAVDWYVTHVGLEAVVSTAQVAVLHPLDGGAGVVLRCSKDTSRATVWFEVPDAGALAAERGVAATEVATGLLVEIEDPWGNTIGFTDYSRRPELGHASSSTEEP